jgi:hypothetical protein
MGSAIKAAMRQIQANIPGQMPRNHARLPKLLASLLGQPQISNAGKFDGSMG